MDLRRRNIKAAGSQGTNSDIREPLLSESHAASSSDYAKEGRRSFALVPYSVNRIDWEALWSAVANACKAGWNGIIATITSCFGTVSATDSKTEVHLSTNQIERLKSLQQKLQQGYDAQNREHQDALIQLWSFAFPGEPFTAFKNDKWTEMGWQRDDPGSDFRGAGVFALENLLYLAKHQLDLFNKLRHKSEGSRSEWEYPFAVAGVNLTFMLEEVLDLRKQHTGHVGHIPQTAAGCTFLDLLEHNSNVFEEVYCMSFEALDKAWLEMKASYMDFTAVMNRVRGQIHTALSRNPKCLEDLRSLLLH